MKKSLTLAVLILVAAYGAKAQSITNQGSLSTNANPFVMIYNYFTGFNTNLTAAFSTNNNYEAWMGASYQSSVFLGGTIGLEAQPISKLHGLTLRNVETLAPQVGTLAAADFDLGYSFVYVDTRTTPFVGLDLLNKIGSENQPESACFAFGCEFQKAISQNAFTGIYVEGLTRTKGALIIGFTTGVTF